MKKKVRSPVAPSAATPCRLLSIRIRLLCALIVSWLMLVASPTPRRGHFLAWNTRAHAQAEPSNREPPTWAVQVDPRSRCAADPDFAPTLAEPIPPRQRASAESAELVATVTISREANALHASVQVFDQVLRSPAGSRELSLPVSGCAEAADALALVIGVLVEAGRAAPASAERPPEPPPPPPQPPPAPPEPEPPPEPAPEPEEPPQPAKRYAWLGPRAGHDLAFQAGMGWGLLPGVYGGGMVGWGIRPARIWPIWISATGSWPHDSSNEHGQFSAVYGGISICPLSGVRGRWSGQVCPGFWAGAMWAQGHKLRNTLAQSEPVALLGIELKADYRIVGPLALGLTGRVAAPLIRQQFVFNRPTDAPSGTEAVGIYQVAPVTITLVAGPTLHFR
jgi:hypothetical protein